MTLLVCSMWKRDLKDSWTVFVSRVCGKIVRELAPIIVTVVSQSNKFLGLMEMWGETHHACPIRIRHRVNFFHSKGGVVFGAR